MEESATLGNGHYRYRICRASGDQVGPLEWIDRDIDLHLHIRLADFFTDIQHRCFVSLPFPNDDYTIDL